jgi:DNA-binding IclR family transcriptional regulator
VTAQTLDRGLRVLELVATRGRPTTPAELGTETGLHRTIIHRLLTTLAHHGLVIRVNGAYGPGPGLVALARDVHTSVRAVAMPVLGPLADTARATAVISVADGTDAVALVAVEPRDTTIHVAYRAGARHPLTVGASGIAILAGRPRSPGEPASVARARRLGYAATKGQLEPGAVGLAAAIPGLDASVAVVTIGAFDHTRVAPLVVSAAAQIAGAFSNSD